MKKPVDFFHRRLRFLLHRLVVRLSILLSISTLPERRIAHAGRIGTKSVAISIKAGKLTANLLKKALEKALAEMTKSQKNPKIYKGKQSVKHLVRQGAGVSNIEITDGNIKSFERVPVNTVLISH